jgi:hypothetical protein
VGKDLVRGDEADLPAVEVEVLAAFEELDVPLGSVRVCTMWASGKA